MKSLVLRIVAIIGLVGLFASGSAFAANELVMQKVAGDAPVLLASGSHNPCGHGHDKAHSKSHGNACNPCAANPCAANPCGDNPCATNPCADNPCGHSN